MTYRIIVRPEAEREIQEAFDWYEERSEGLGAEFLRAADACLSAVQRTPEASQTAHSEVRRALLRKFPYALFYPRGYDRCSCMFSCQAQSGRLAASRLISNTYLTTHTRATPFVASLS
jgi:plasmid stabilization system protein ParE